ncbi:MAG: UDP-N-acetylmuramoyl-L-alanyl-D-glutamate--2,6-diaminopimelate ligase [Kiritimatiellae bacterium]|nr:UDP-N-acetylmuramoyl-L-alanyl-D-glutamate--2,6-diaminopimelate ligase [Kiritimatiellia bacterium]MDW8458218.1 UDP-N-acetylmuramoyl-L-alanyl-D-glutamate--2,6-diaminopimelate ligase [Verrucomicrobiota bacterium]
MRLESITRIVQPIQVRGPLHFDIEGIAYDSRQVKENYLFVAIKGRNADGAAYIDDAIRRGAVAIVSEEDRWPRRNIAHILVEDARRALAEIACAFYDNPSHRLPLVGITGTNGKTTTSFMIRDILAAEGRSPGLIGTVRYEIGSRVIPATRTTPEAPDIQFMLDQMLRAGCRSAVMEVSSHALAQRRVWGIDFDVGVFTNLSRDHLDFHGTMEAYFDAKMQLFRGLGLQIKRASAVVNIDNPWGMELVQTRGLRARLITFGEHPAADVRAEDIDLGPSGTRFVVRSPWGDCDAHLRLLGRFNVSNALAAIAACGALGIPPARSAAILAGLSNVPGRLERIETGRGFDVFVDYAHTDDALAKVLETLRELGPRRLIVVFGCGGDRDRSKRPLMGAVAYQRADWTILTSDNPRRERPESIIAEIEEGMPNRDRHEVVVDRAEAIARALEIARPGDIVLIAGKGHETVQEFATTVVPFDDREVVRLLLR